jgi:hypothetical protein
VRNVRRIFLLAALVSLLVPSGCSQPGGGSLSNAQAQAIAQAVMSAFGSDGGPKSIVSQKAVGYTASVTPITNGDSFTYTFTGGYSYNGVTFNSGTATLSLTETSTYYDARQAVMPSPPFRNCCSRYQPPIRSVVHIGPKAGHQRPAAGPAWTTVVAQVDSVS